MGQKVHPYGFRLGYNKTWRSRWYAERDYGKLLHEDLKLKRQLKKRFSHAGVSRVEIERAANKLKINIHTSRPGIIIGRKGTEVDKLKTGNSGHDPARGLYQHHRGSQTGARRAARCGVDRVAARKTHRVSPSHAQGHRCHDALRRERRSSPLCGSAERRGDRALRVVSARAGSVAHACGPISITASPKRSRPTVRSASSVGSIKGSRSHGTRPVERRAQRPLAVGRRTE